MKQFRIILLKVLFPKLAVVLISIPVAAALLIYTFAFENENSPVAHLAYVFSAYSLTIVCAWIVRNAKGMKDGTEAAIQKIPLLHRYFTDEPFKLHISLCLSLGINILYAVMKFVCGLYYHSVWFGTLAAYYILLAIMRFSLLNHASRNALGKNVVSELRQYRQCGIILMIMNIALMGVVILVVSKNEGFVYAGYLIYVMAMYAFYNVFTAVRDVVKYRKYKSPVMSAAKAVKLAAALVSMLSLETAMLNQFDNGTNPDTFRQVMTGMTGGCVCIIVLAIAVYMIVNSTKQIKETN